MFVEYLSKRQQGALLYYAETVIGVDGLTHPSESEHMAVLKRQVDPGVTPEGIDIRELPKLFDDRRSRMAFLLEVTAVGYVDDDFDLDESILLHEIAKALTIEEEMPVIRSWVTRQLLLVKEAHLLMED